MRRKIPSMCNKIDIFMDSANFLISLFRNFRSRRIEKRKKKSNKFLAYEINMQTHCKLSIKKSK